MKRQTSRTEPPFSISFDLPILLSEFTDMRVSYPSFFLLWMGCRIPFAIMHPSINVQVMCQTPAKHIARQTDLYVFPYYYRLILTRRYCTSQSECIKRPIIDEKNDLKKKKSFV